MAGGRGRNVDIPEWVGDREQVGTMTAEGLLEFDRTMKRLLGMSEPPIGVPSEPDRRCRYCGTLVRDELAKCPGCGAGY